MVRLHVSKLIFVYNPGWRSRPNIIQPESVISMLDCQLLVHTLTFESVISMLDCQFLVHTLTSESVISMLVCQFMVHTLTSEFVISMLDCQFLVHTLTSESVISMLDWNLFNMNILDNILFVQNRYFIFVKILDIGIKFDVWFIQVYGLLSAFINKFHCIFMINMFRQISFF